MESGCTGWCHSKLLSHSLRVSIRHTTIGLFGQREGPDPASGSQIEPENSGDNGLQVTILVILKIIKMRKRYID
ncbi:hypothetical protein M378DRAFT_160900 [Amanita muscaria Koide BX008]|uniref:Uncharacterized protein n=1 Tax=Amanita muscaria (strain Koide BX008) TaxID=946122 RepID=A0A0C2THM7_AMAMK|nr:hypothetical protein M378DRAFT_160900 [Amanita muscaria Koide BX008]